MKILVAGVNTKQVMTLRREFKDVEIITLDHQKRPKQVPSSYSWYFLWVRFLSHDQQDVIEKCAPKERIKIIRGGLSAVREHLATVSKI